MKKRVFEKGTIKVVWIEDDVEKIYSKMFDDIGSAQKFAKNRENYLIFKLIWQKDLEEFAWEILPYGNYKLYKLLIKYYKMFKGNILKLLEKKF